MKFLAIALSVFGSAVLAQDISFAAPDASDALRAKLRDASLSLALGNDNAPDSQDYVAAARADYRRLLTALYNDGYFGGTISIKVNGREAATLAPLDAPAKIATIAISVTPGPAFSFGQTQITPVHSATVLPNSFAPNLPAKTAVIKQAVTTAIDGWRDAGHAKAAPSGQSITARHPQKMLDVGVTLAPGPQLRFGQLTVTGNTDVNAARIATIAGLPVGEIYAPSQVTLAMRRLRKTGAFDSVSATEADQIGPDDTLPITINVSESKPRRFGFGIELSTIEGLKVSSFWMHRNFLGGAERLRVDGQISGIGGETGGVDYRLGASFDRPAIYGPDTDLFVRAEITREDEPDYLIDKASLEIGATRILSDDIVGEIGVGLLTAHEETPNLTRDYTLLTLPLAATLDRRDDKTDAKDGYYLRASATPFLSLQDSTSGARFYTDARAYRTFGDAGQLTLAGRAQLGAVLNTQINNAPADYLFYSGGGGTVRGQSYKSLAVDSVAGGTTIRTGGLSFAGAQLEARYQASENIGLVGFYDYGQVSAGADFADATWHGGVGLGLRYNTGIGPIRLDLGTPAHGADAFGSLQVYIGIGQAF